jgi:hypothetical protein
MKILRGPDLWEQYSQKFWLSRLKAELRMIQQPRGVYTIKLGKRGEAGVV